MKLFISFFLIIAFSAFIWSCSDEAQFPTTSSDSEESFVADDEFDAELSLEKSGASREAEFEVTLENLTPATAPGASQPFSPPVLVTHKSHVRLFHVRRYASDELRQIAEDAVNAPMVEMLNNSRKVFDVVEGSGVILPGTSASFTIKAKRGFGKFSLVAMLVNTNDAFTGISKARLPRKGTKEYYLYAYDAGTEKNTESTAHIPGPCCGNPLMRVPTHEKIRFHKGILGAGDLDPAVYGWEKAVAKLTITRIN